MSITCLCSLLVGLGLSTNGEFVELDKSVHGGQIGLFHSTTQNDGEKFDSTGFLGRVNLFSPSRHSKIMAGLTLDIEHHSNSKFYNETYVASIPSLIFMGEPSITHDIKFFVDAEPGKGFYTLKGDEVKTKRGVEGKYNFSVGLLFKID